MTTKQFLPLPYGKDDFDNLKADGCYFVDKTSYLKDVVDTDKSYVMLFTRPRRFGKSLFMTMAESFLKIDSDNPGDTTLQQKTFKDTKILDDKEFCQKYMGQYPVICLTLKGVQGDDFEDAYYKLAEIVSAKADEYSFLKDSPALDEKEKAKFDKLCDEDYLKNFDKKTRSYVTSSIISLAKMLYKHFKKQVYVLIDEYDVPLAKAQEKGYHDKMVTLITSLFDFFKTPPKDLKTNELYVKKVIMTGCLKVAKNSIFTGVNNLYVNTVVDREPEYTGIIGFTKEDTYQFLKDYELNDFAQKVKDNYDGYKFYDKEMFCPWDVVNFIKKNFNFQQNCPAEKIKAGNYWATSTSSSAVYEYLGYLTDSDTQKMQDLVDGKSISFKLNDSMNYDCLSEHEPNDFWSLLLHTGYLTVDWEKTDALTPNESNPDDIVVRLPNLEIKDCFTKNIQKRFNDVFVNLKLPGKFVNALIKGQQVDISNILFDMLQKYVSIRDTATKAPLENYYHGFINGIFTSCEKLVSEYHSNYEAGNGYPDITFKAERNTKAVIIEIKATSKAEEMDELAAIALRQIEEKNYAEPFTKIAKITDIYAYGIAFCKKDCSLVVKNLKAKK
ncbi:MAG: AAA family ATPase [Succinivibrio sp.]|nr:AAA family ATPase [Succinivibrio sp.]